MSQPHTQDFEKLGVFYLGRDHDMAAEQTGNAPLLYDAKDLTTHAVCVGMTGSGKTGLCISLLEEAALDGVPAIAIDPKGDLANLFLTFPQLRAEDFRPWIDESAAERKGITPDEFAQQTAELWRNGLADWNQDGARIARMREAIDLGLYTPGSSAGQPVSVLRSFNAPSEESLHDADAIRERVASAASSLLALLDIDADPVNSREHILISNLLDHSWRAGQDMSLPDLIRGIQEPPFDKLGVIDVETFFPAKDRLALSLRLNNLLASPAFATWMEGEPLDIQRLLYTTEAKPRLSIMSIAHLSEAERMFFVTMLLNEVLTWVRRQPGTSSLRALIYMDEVFGYFPPTANPPSKKPMLTLLKQARAHGVGILLATQNPVDLDYKGLSNTGTWFLGRLQTERDKARVLEGLEGASASTGATFDRSDMEATLAGLGQRVFLMNNVHEDAPAIFKTRWALSFLAGPLTRTQIQKLTHTEGDGDQRKETKDTRQEESAIASQTSSAEDELFSDLTPVAVGKPESARTNAGSRQTKSPIKKKFDTNSATTAHSASNRPILASGLEERFLPVSTELASDARLIFRPALVATVQLHYIRAGCRVDHWETAKFFAPLDPDVSAGELWTALKPWPTKFPVNVDPAGTAENVSVSYAPLPDAVIRSRGLASCQRALRDTLYRSQRLQVFSSPRWKTHSAPGESEAEFRIQLRQKAFEERDEQLEKLRDKYAEKFAKLKRKIEDAEARVEREQAQYQEKQADSVISISSSILGAVLGRKWASRTNVNHAGSSMRKVSRTASERGDVKRAEEKVEALQQELKDAEAQLKTETERIQSMTSTQEHALQTISLPPRKSDIIIDALALLWTPWQEEVTSGTMTPAFTTSTIVAPATALDS
ncbi:MAG: DUF87 domain-containing protein [Pirellulales bacterium]|nr:DUF87 domain-containing protein [Pirellulales bacterium]